MTAPVLSLEDATRLTADWRRAGKRVAAVSGSFDILHDGHRRLLAEAKAAGEMLIVLVNSDASVRAYKGPGRPVNDARMRASRIAAQDGVDAVTIFDELVPLAALEKIKPDVLANGPEYGADCIERPLVESWGGKIVMTSPRARGESSSAMARGQGALENPRAILLDRDGTLIEDPGYLSKPEEVVWKDGAMAALTRLQRAGFLIIITTNQSGIGRGYFTVKEMEEVHARIRNDLARAGVRLIAIYHCPHRPDEGCDCRKPATGMLLQAARENGLDLSKSWMVGDKCSDILAGRRTNMLTALVHSAADCSPSAHVRTESLAEAVDRILAWS